MGGDNACDVGTGCEVTEGGLNEEVGVPVECAGVLLEGGVAVAVGCELSGECGAADTDSSGAAVSMACEGDSEV